MRLLDRYLLRELLIPLGLCLGGFLIFWNFFDVSNELPAIQKAHLGFKDVLEMCLLRLPGALNFVVMPVSLLLALLYALTNHARHNELLAMRAAGITLWRLSIPYVIVGILVSVGLFILTEFVAPNGDDRAQEIFERYSTNQVSSVEKQWQHNLNFNNDRERRTWHMDAYNVETHEMVKPIVTWIQPDGTRKKLFSDRGALTNGVWTFYGNAELFTQSPSADIPQRLTTNEIAVPEFDETPRLIKSEIKISQMDAYKVSKRVRFTLAEIFDYKRLHPDLKSDMRARLNTQLNGRLAQPWTCLVVVLIALPFGSLTGRRNVFVGVAAGIFICFGFFFLRQLVFALGTSGTLPGWLAAWLPHLIFAGAGIVMIKRVR